MAIIVLCALGMAFIVKTQNITGISGEKIVPSIRVERGLAWRKAEGHQEIQTHLDNLLKSIKIF